MTALPGAAGAAGPVAGPPAGPVPGPVAPAGPAAGAAGGALPSPAPVPLDKVVLAWLAWMYITGVTQLAGFVLWYRAMALAGVARTSQLQLLQPFLTLLAARVGLGEPVGGITVLAALAVAAVVAVGRRAPVDLVPGPAAQGEARLLAKG